MPIEPGQLLVSGEDQSADLRQLDADHGRSMLDDCFDGGGREVEAARIRGEVVQQQRELTVSYPPRKYELLTLTLELTAAKCETIWDWSALNKPAK